VDANGIIQYVINTFTVSGTVSCDPDPNSPSVLSIPLKINGIWVGLTIDNPDPSLLVSNVLTISNLKNPSVFNTYTVSLVVYTSASTSALETFSQNIPISAPSFILTKTIYSTYSLDYSLVEFKFNAPVAMAKGNRQLTNFYDQFTKIVFKFPQMSTATLAAFPYDLGYVSTTASRKYIPCWAGGDLATFAGGLQCQMIYGKSTGTLTTSDYITVVVTNYKSLKANDIVSVSLMLKYSDIATPTATAIGSVVNIVSNEEFTIGQSTIPLGTTYNGAPVAFGTLTVTATPLEVQAQMTATLTFTLPAGLAINNPAVMVKIPPAWEFSTSIFAPTTVFLNGVQLFTGKFYFNSYNKVLYVTPKDDFAAGTFILNLVNIKGPPGQVAVNTFTVTYLSANNKVTESTTAPLAIACFPLAALAVSTDVPKYSAKGATYFFAWTAAKNYQKPKIVINLPVGPVEYLFTGVEQCDLYINGVRKLL
jgi:hypothetical protein